MWWTGQWEQLEIISEGNMQAGIITIATSDNIIIIVITNIVFQNASFNDFLK